MRRYLAYPVRLRDIEVIMQERGVCFDHATVQLGTIKVLPVLAAVFPKRKRPVGSNWRMDETYIKVARKWKYLYRAVHRTDDTVDLPRTAKRDRAAARRFLDRAINRHDAPDN